MEERVRKALVVLTQTWCSTVLIQQQSLSADFQQENMIATLTMLFGVLGLVLAALGCTV